MEGRKKENKRKTCYHKLRYLLVLVPNFGYLLTVRCHLEMAQSF
jgi:hypothetical protein